MAKKFAMVKKFIESERYRPYFFWGVGSLLILAFLISVIPLVYENTASSGGDQRVYLKIALWIRHFGLLTDGNLHPLYSVFLLPFVTPHLSFFTSAKLVSMVMGGVGLGIIFVLSSRIVGWGGAMLVLILMIINAEYRYTTTIVGVEILLVGLFFLAWYTAVKMIDAPGRSGVWWAVAAGAFAGLVYLAKGNGSLLVPLTLAVLFLVKGIRGVISWRALFFILSFMLVALPLWIFNTDHYGNPLFNVNTTNYMWLDSWEESYVYDPQELPTLGTYWQTHTPSQIGERMKNGLLLALPRQWYGAVQSEWMPAWRWMAHGAAVMALIILVLVVIRARTQPGWQKRRGPLLYTLLGILLFAVLFAWYHPVSDSPRFVIVWTPILYTAVVWLVQSFIPIDKKPVYEALVLVGGLVCLVALLFAYTPYLPRLAEMAEHDRQAGQVSVDFMTSLQQKTAVGEAFLMGPTHEQAEWLAYDRRPLTIPHVHANWPYVTTILLQEDIEYILLDKETFTRRQLLLGRYWTLSEAGLTAETLPPGWDLVKPQSHPCDPCLYSFDRRLFEAEVPRQIAYDTIAEVTGYSLSPVVPDEPFGLTTHWRLLTDVQETIHVFVHVLDESGQMVAQHDGPLEMDMAYYLAHYPEEMFPTGSVIRLEHPMPPLAPGEYQIHMGLYRWSSQERVPVVGAGGENMGDYPLLLSLSVN